MNDPKRIKADIERALIIAYYELVCGLNASLDSEGGKLEEVLVLAWSPELLIGMDFNDDENLTSKNLFKKGMLRGRRSFNMPFFLNKN